MAQTSSKKRALAARAFADAWEGRGNEKQDSRTFWLGIAQEVLGMGYAEFMTQILFEQPVRLENTTGYVDVYMPDAGVVVELKSFGVSLDKPEPRHGKVLTPFEQAMDYVDAMEPGSVRFVITCNFSTFRVWDIKSCPRNKLAASYREFTLDELGSSPNLLGFITDPSNSRSEAERDVSIVAARKIGELYEGLRAQYLDPDAPESLHALNVLCVRLVFCLFCEDAGLFEKDAFLDYLRKVEPENMRTALKQLFAVLDTPESKRDPYLAGKLAAFPYVNGGLFTEDLEIPNFTNELKFTLLFETSQQVNWAAISPTVFGGIFESTLDPKTRAKGGMHYTSPENIHKVIDPLFLDGLYEEFSNIRDKTIIMPRERKKHYQALLTKIGNLHFFDPACGSGNFLTETYLSLRKLEDMVRTELGGGQTGLAFDEVETHGHVTLNQFFGIEINDFACRVATTALWIAKLQANARTESMLSDVGVDDFPLREGATIVCSNALRTDWESVLPAAECDYVMGNPPFLGYSSLDAKQKEERKAVFGGGGGTLDYVACWYRKAADYMLTARKTDTTPPRCAFVSTNSICQGQQVEALWRPLMAEGFSIDFAHDTFRWSNEADEQAHVFCVIVGFSLGRSSAPKRLFHHEGPDTDAVELRPAHINAYLADAPNVFVAKRAKPLCAAPAMVRGCGATDGGNLLLSPAERDELLAAEPEAAKWVRRFLGSSEFINGKDRYCLWLEGCRPADYKHLPLVNERVNAVRRFRKTSKKVATQKKAATPWLFDEVRPPKGEYYVAVPKTSSERRLYIPVGFVGGETIPGDALFFVSDVALYHFGVMCSHAHNAWMRRVCGRLKSDYRYSATIVYNNFPWPGSVTAARKHGLAEALSTPVDQLVAADVRQCIESCAQAVLDARNLYPDATLAQLYDPENAEYYPKLVEAHAALDEAVEAAYASDFAITATQSSANRHQRKSGAAPTASTTAASEDALVAHLFAAYAELTTN